MLAAITTRYHGPQGSRGSRICARSKSGRIIVGYDHSKSCDQNHAEAAKELARRNGWCGSWYGGARRVPPHVQGSLRRQDHEPRSHDDG